MHTHVDVDVIHASTTDMKNIGLSSLQLLLSLLLLSTAFVVVPHGVRMRGGEGFDEDHDARREWERIRLCDPRTGRIPSNVRAQELAFAAQLPSREDQGLGIMANAWSNPMTEAHHGNPSPRRE